MKPATALLLGANNDPHLDALDAALRARGATVARVNGREAPFGPSVRYAPDDGSALGDTRLDDVRAAFVRAAPPRHPTFAFGEEPLSLDDARTAEAEGGALRDAVCAALLRLTDDGRPVLNPPVAGVYEQQKPRQLARARAAGLAIPRTLVTNDEAAARAFVRGTAAAGGETIAKPVRGPGYATRVREGDARLARVPRAPIVLQERAPGDDVRVLLLDGRVLACARITGTAGVDFRADPAYRAGDAGYAPMELADDVVRRLAALARELGIVFGGADLRVPATGAPVFLELNAAPAWLELERRTQTDVTGALVMHLLGSS